VASYWPPTREYRWRSTRWSTGPPAVTTAFVDPTPRTTDARTDEGRAAVENHVATLAALLEDLEE